MKRREGPLNLQSNNGLCFNFYFFPQSSNLSKILRGRNTFFSPQIQYGFSTFCNRTIRVSGILLPCGAFTTRSSLTLGVKQNIFSSYWRPVFSRGVCHILLILFQLSNPCLILSCAFSLSFLNGLSKSPSQRTRRKPVHYGPMS